MSATDPWFLGQYRPILWFLQFQWRLPP